MLTPFFSRLKAVGALYKGHRVGKIPKQDEKVEKTGET
jgi:hypothetical protein